MTDPRRYRVAIDQDVMNDIRVIAKAKDNNNATKTINTLVREALRGKSKRPCDTAIPASRVKQMLRSLDAALLNDRATMAIRYTANKFNIKID